MNEDYWRLDAEVWQDPDTGEYNYFAAQSFDEEGRDSEILAHGSANDRPDAIKQIHQALGEVLN